MAMIKQILCLMLIPVIGFSGDLASWVQSAQKYTATGDRIAYLSRLFIDGDEAAVYLAGPLAEGTYCDYNCKPLYRFDAFDCTTFVEMMLALATTDAAGDANYIKKSFDNQVKEIRYQRPDHLSYLTRNHFPEVDWVPHNTRVGGLLTDVTGGLGVDPVETPPALIDKKNWYAHRTLNDICVWDSTCSAPADVQQQKLATLQKAGQTMQNETVTVLYLPTDALLKGGEATMRRIPNGAIVQFIRPNWDAGSTHMHVAHQGIVVQDAAGTWLHHASSAHEAMQRVKLAEYLSRQWHCGKTITRETCISGIQVLKPAL